MDKLIIIPTYNERENIDEMLTRLLALPHGLDVLIVDDHSPDGTGDWADQAAAADQRLHVLHRPGKLGLGTAILAAMRYALDNHYDVFVNMDADFSHDPRYLPTLEKLVAIELGPKPEHEIRNSLEREVTAERWTRLDQEIRMAADETGYIDLRPVGPGSFDSEIRRLMVGRLKHLEKMGLVDRNDIAYRRVVRFQYGYPVYDLDYRKNVTVLRESIARTGLHLLGRFAQFDYINSDVCVERALALAKTLNDV